jgi:hypothetical protein
MAIISTYALDITGLLGTAASLDHLGTRSLDTLTVVRIVQGIPRAESSWQLVLGAADPAQAYPAQPFDQVAPLDYDPDLNNRHWAKVGGY